MHHLGLDLDGAVEWAASYHRDAQKRFLDAMKLVPSFGSAAVDVELETYINRIAFWVRANYCWSFEGGRYFGDRGVEYQTTRRVPLLRRGDSANTVAVVPVDGLGKAVARPDARGARQSSAAEF